MNVELQKASLLRLFLALLIVPTPFALLLTVVLGTDRFFLLGMSGLLVAGLLLRHVVYPSKWLMVLVGLAWGTLGFLLALGAWSPLS